MDAKDDLDAVADELYALPLGEFVAARTEKEKAARAAGRRDLAAAVKALGKPSAAAGLANQLVRAHPDEVQALRDLGDAMREATLARDGARLRELSAARNKAVDDLLGRARRLARDAGGKVTDDTARGLEETLRAAAADAVLGAQLAAGRLTDVLEQSGFPGVFAPGPDADAPRAKERPAQQGPAEGKAATPAGRTRRPKPDPAAARAEAAAKRLAESAARLDSARAEAEAAAADLDDARALADARTAEAEAVEERIARLRAELEQAEDERRRAAGNSRRARTQLATAERSARAAARRLAELTEAHAQLEG